MLRIPLPLGLTYFYTIKDIFVKCSHDLNKPFAQKTF